MNCVPAQIGRHVVAESLVRIASIYPTLLGTYGDGGNVIALRHRAALHGLATEVIDVEPNHRVPRQADIYVLGGGEDTAQVAAANALRADGGLAEAAARSAPILAICAGYQLIGLEFPDAEGKPAAGVGLLDIRTDRLPQRAVGELLADPIRTDSGLIDEPLTGYENHAGATHRSQGVAALATVRFGVGNGDGTEGSIAGHTIGTYLHGPCLARNPQVADQLLSWTVDRPLEPVDEAEVAALRAERISFVSRLK